MVVYSENSSVQNLSLSPGSEEAEGMKKYLEPRVPVAPWELLCCVHAKNLYLCRLSFAWSYTKGCRGEELVANPGYLSSSENTSVRNQWLTLYRKTVHISLLNPM